MERKKKEAVRGKHIKEKPDSKLTPKAAMRRAGRYKAIEAARKQVQEAQQSPAPQQDQEPYSATDKVESYTAGAVHEIIRFPRHENNPFHRETDYREAPEPKARPSHAYTQHEAPAPKASTLQERMRREMVREYRQTKDFSPGTMRNADTPKAEAPAPQRHTHNEAPASKAPTPQERMRREPVKEYRQAKAEQGKNAFHHETDYIEAPAPKQPTPQERMRRETVKEYRQTIAEQAKNAFHRETDYAETLAPKQPTPQERMRRESVKEYRQARAEHGINAFHRETDYPDPAPRAEKPQKQMLQTFLDGEKETAPILQASEAPTLSPIRNEAKSVKPRIQPKKREVRESVKTPINRVERG